MPGTALYARFCEHLRGGARAETAAAISPELAAAGYPLEAALVGRHGWTDGVDTGPWAGRRVYVGRTPPPDGKIGELWLDTVELVAMILIEEPARRHDAGPTRAWFAVRPVARWQFRAFVACAPIVERSVQVAPARPPFASAREAGDDAAPMTDLTFGEATLYANWFGKGTPNRYEWQGPARSLGDAFAALWVPELYEWGGHGANEEHRIRIAAHTWDRSPYGRDEDEPDDLDDAERDDMVADELDHLADTGFRTIASIDPRALASAPERLSTMEPVALERPFAR